MVLNDNQFYTGLTNLALYIAMYATNKSSKSKSLIDNFTTDNLAFGDSKIFRSLPFPTVGDYSENSSLLGNHTPSFVPRGSTEPINVIEEVIDINNFKLIKNSYNLQMLEMAVKSEYGMSDFVAIVLGNIEAAKIDFLYDQILSLLYNGNYYGEAEVQLLDLTSLTEPTEIQAGETINQKKISLKVQEVIDAMTTFSENFNKYGLKQSVDMSDLRLIIFQPWQNKAVVDLFAELLNSKYISENFPKPELITIPEAKAKDVEGYNSKIVGIICHKAHFQLFYKLVYMGEFYDASTLRVNNFLHFWYGMGQVEQLPNCVIKIAE